jgi:filamentous hemagglutinin family protein
MMNKSINLWCWDRDRISLNDRFFEKASFGMTQSGRSRCWKLAIASSVFVGGAIASLGDCAKAQLNLTPDEAPERNLGTQVEALTPLVDQIQGGTQQGNNLFHSFSEFNVREGRSVYFENPAEVTNILSRVTGNDLSDILGTLGVGAPGALGTANLFLINPNGIIFGPNARLDVGGSFVATTANAIAFGDQGFFSASEPNVSPLLTVNPSAFFFNQIAAAPVINQSIAQDATNPTKVDGLRVPDSQSLLLVGGNVNLDGGVLKAPGGHIELGGLADTGIVGLSVNSNSLRLHFPIEAQRADVSLTNKAEVNVSAGGGGSIAINARNLGISGVSRLLAGIGKGLGSVDTKAGNIEINTTEAITLTGATSLTQRSSIANSVQPGAIGQGGNIYIATGSLSVTNGAELTTSTNGRGNAGNVIVVAHDTVKFEGGQGKGSNFASSRAYSRVEQGAEGQAGNIHITTGAFSAINGAFLSASVRGQGNAGNVIIDARDTVEFDGVGSDGISSGAYSQSLLGAVGNGGNVNITAESLFVRNGAQLTVNSRQQGNSGIVTINARNAIYLDGVGSNRQSSAVSSQVGSRVEGNSGGISIMTGSLYLTNGALLTVSTLGKGDAGNVTINARDAIYLDGVGSNKQSSAVLSQVNPESNGDSGSIIITTGSLYLTNGAYLATNTNGEGNAGGVIIYGRDTVSFDGVGSNTYRSGVFTEVNPKSNGNGGGISITTGSLYLTNGALLSASSTGNGAAGNIVAEADSIHLDTGTLSSNTVGGEGNINLRSRSLVLRRGSTITTNATGSKIIGGNISIDIGVLAALENSDISANSEEFRGGQVIIKAQGIYGTEFREAPTPESDITATGGRPELSGTVEIITPDVDPNSGLVELPATPVDPTRWIAQGCAADKESAFTMTGRGGLPPSPSEALRSDAVRVDLDTPIQSQQNRASAAVTVNPTSSEPKPLVEAQGWVMNDKREVVLVAQAPTVTPYSSPSTPATCDAF